MSESTDSNPMAPEPVEPGQPPPEIGGGPVAVPDWDATPDGGGGGLKNEMNAISQEFYCVIAGRRVSQEKARYMAAGLGGIIVLLLIIAAWPSGSSVPSVQNNVVMQDSANPAPPAGMVLVETTLNLDISVVEADRAGFEAVCIFH